MEKPKWARLKIQQLSKTEPVLQGQQWDPNTRKIHFFLVKRVFMYLSGLPAQLDGEHLVLLPYAESG